MLRNLGIICEMSNANQCLEMDPYYETKSFIWATDIVTSQNKMRFFTPIVEWLDGDIGDIWNLWWDHFFPSFYCTAIMVGWRKSNYFYIIGQKENDHRWCLLNISRVAKMVFCFELRNFDMYETQAQT